MPSAKEIYSGPTFLMRLMPTRLSRRNLGNKSQIRMNGQWNFFQRVEQNKVEKSGVEIRNWQHMFRLLWLVVLAVVALQSLLHGWILTATRISSPVGVPKQVAYR